MHHTRHCGLTWQLITQGAPGVQLEEQGSSSSSLRHPSPPPPLPATAEAAVHHRYQGDNGSNDKDADKEVTADLNVCAACVVTEATNALSVSSGSWLRQRGIHASGLHFLFLRRQLR